MPGLSALAAFQGVRGEVDLFAPLCCVRQPSRSPWNGAHADVGAGSAMW